MPQLDILIAFPQIIWFLIIFTLFYFLLTFYFLPLFLKSIKSKKLFIEINNFDNSKIMNNIFYNQKKKIILLNYNFKLLKQKIFVLSTNFDYKKSNSLKHLLILILNSSKQVISYCNNSVFNSIIFYPNYLNLKKFKKN